MYENRMYTKESGENIMIDSELDQREAKERWVG